MRIGAIVAALGALALALLFASAGGGDPEAGHHGDVPPGARLSPADPALPARGPRNPPVVIVVFDEFPTDSLIGRDGLIDPNRYPNFERFAREGYWFPNAHTVYDATPKAVPAILDGQLPERRRRAVPRDHPNSVYTMLARRGYRVVDSEESGRICPERLCPGARLAGSTLSRLASGREARLNGWMARIEGRRQMLYVKHALLPHGPWIYLPSGRQHRLGARDPVRGIAGPPGFGDRDLTEVQRLRHMLQVGHADRQIGRLRERLEREGVWDDALVVVTADHGHSWQLGVPSRRIADRSNIHEIAPVPLFLKAPRQRRGRTVPSQVRTVDIVATIADILNIDPGYEMDGRSAFSETTRRRGYVRLIRRDFEGTIRISAETMERRRARAVRRKLRLFGVGPAAGRDWRLYRGIGPHRELLGRPVSRLRTLPPTGTRAELADLSADHLADVDLSSRLRPIHIAGTLTPPGSKRDVAVALNGAVQAVSRTFYLDGRDFEAFTVVVPEWVLREGPNEVEVFQILTGGERPRLRPLTR